MHFKDLQKYNKNTKTGIYIHIPFCVKKCNYCDFNSGSFSEEIKDKYIKKLCEEIKEYGKNFGSLNVDTIFIGGGTPSILDVKQISSVFDSIHSSFEINPNAESTIECNPGTLNRDKLEAYKSFGINRLSIGLQSANDDELSVLGRIHKFDDFLRNYNLAREIGFDNINVDLISALPNQTLSSFEKTLITVKDLNPEHISVYSLIIEEGTPFYDMNRQNKLALPNEDDEREMIHIIPKLLGDEYRQYEISNYAKPCYECRHNIKYWTRKPYLGFGISAAGLIIFDSDKRIVGNDVSESMENALMDDFGIRYKNTSDIGRYMDFDFSSLSFNVENTFFDEYEELNKDEAISEYIFLGLRMNKGIDLDDFSKQFNLKIEEKYKNEIDKHIKEGLLVREENKLFFSEKGRDLSNYVLSDFV